MKQKILHHIIVEGKILTFLNSPLEILTVCGGIFVA